MLSLKSDALTCFFLISFFSLYAQTDDQRKALQALDDAIDNTSRINAYTDLHNAYFKSDPDKSGYYAKQLLVLAQKVNSAKSISKGYRALACCERKKHNYANIFCKY